MNEKYKMNVNETWHMQGERRRKATKRVKTEGYAGKLKKYGRMWSVLFS